MTDSLTLRQRFYLTQVFLGKTNVQIAQEQGVCVSTVKRALGDAYQKLGINSTRQLFPLVIMAGREARLEFKNGSSIATDFSQKLVKAYPMEEEVVA